MPHAVTLSESALSLLRRRFAGERVEVLPDNRAAYRELAEAGLMEPIHTFAKVRDSHYRMPKAAADLRDRLNDSSPSPSPRGSAAIPS